MTSSNYLVEFLYGVDVLLSEINKLDSKIRMYKRNSEMFGIEYEVKFSVSPDNFVKLRDFLQKRIDEGTRYDRDIINLKREFFRELPYIVTKIQKEILRINYVQEVKMNKVVNEAILNAKIENEEKIMRSYDTVEGFLDKILGRAKFNKLMIENHGLKKQIIEKQYKSQRVERKTIFDLVNMLENAEVKNGNLLCLEDDIITVFMVDRNVIKRNAENSWKMVSLEPKGFFAQKAYYKTLNKSIANDNENLKKQLRDSVELNWKEESFSKEKLLKLNSKLAKILKEKVVFE